ncbi:DUF2304 domain-containing protein [Arthrobacter sedimenti]|uniref:DUF2304 domain-containing protein n=1 Tax=Arthrobacter sedimenti TaxID=2694931 RepID=UPI000B35BBA4|nr:DUF2304 domain-containing protein [Arthrobacter sedimenti]OUM39814.1 hypothetical protein B8W73_15320 [Arthrobacter agilis]
MSTLFPFLLAFVIVAFIVWLLRQRKLREKYAILWIAVGIATLLLAGFPALLATVATAVGFVVPSNFLFVVAIVLLLGVCLHLSLEISVVEDETRALAEEAAILRNQLESLEGKISLITDSKRPNGREGTVE